MLFQLLTITLGNISKVAQSVIDVCNAVVPVLLTVFGSLGAIWCIFLGVKYAKADDPQKHETAKTELKNAIIGFALIFVLLISLRVGMNVFTQWYTNQ